MTVQEIVNKYPPNKVSIKINKSIDFETFYNNSEII
jgi:hypothetical protein